MVSFRRLRLSSRLLSLFVLLSPPGRAHAQEAGDSLHRDRVWFSGGLGFGRTGGGVRPFSSAFAAGAGMTYQPSVLLFTLRTTGLWNPFRGDVLGDVALLVGAGSRARGSHISLSAGPALSGGDLHVFQGSRSRFSSQLGLGIAAQAMGLPLTAVGLGMTGFANLNSRQSFGGLMLSLSFGQLR